MLSAQIEMEEKREVLANERRLRNPGTTFSQFAQSEAAEGRGRFTAHEQSKVVGSEPLPRYPQLPASSPWAGPDLVPTEPVLGVDINEMEPVGQPHELKASRAVLEPLPPAQEPLDRVMTAKATPSASEKSPLGAEGFSQRAYRRF
jgi:hypothetical protein